MMDTNALIIFAKFPDKSVKTRLKGFLSEQKRIILYEFLLSSTVKKLNTCAGVDVYLCFTPRQKEDYFLRYGLRLFPQSDGDLGMRMFEAFRYVFKIGYQKAVLVGTDVPTLTKRIVMNALYLLERDDVVFGPALDGGYYLIGMKKNYSDIFNGIEWSSPSTLSESITKAQACGLKIGFVESLSDIDTIEDLRKTGIQIDV